MNDWVEMECPQCEGRKIVLGPCHAVEGVGNTNMHRCPKCNATGKVRGYVADTKGSKKPTNKK